MSLKVASITLTVISAVALCIGASLTTVRAAAVWLDLTSPQSTAGLLRLESAPGTPDWQNVLPGERLYWQVAVALDDAASGTLDLELNASGQLVEIDGMTVEVHSCTSAFTPSGSPTIAPICPSGALLVQSTTSLMTVASNHGGGLYSLNVLQQGQPRYLLVTLAIPTTADPVSVNTGTARVGIGLHAAGATPEAPTPVTPPHLVNTGSDLFAVGMLALGGTGLTAGLLLLRRARSTQAPARMHAHASHPIGSGAVAEHITNTQSSSDSGRAS